MLTILLMSLLALGATTRIDPTSALLINTPHLNARVLLQQQSQTQQQQQQPAANCTPPRTLSDSQKPFCFVPDTISPEARGFLAQTSSANVFGAAVSGLSTTDPVKQAAAVSKLRSSFAEMTAPLANATAQYLPNIRNATIGNVSVVIAEPKGATSSSPANTKVLLYIHGGGYAIGSCQYQLSTPAVTAAAAGLTIICPEYRLAPEHPFPAGINDVLTVYKAMIYQQGYNPKNIVLLGDSAGGGMVPAVAIQLQREGVALPAALGMFSPWADLRTRGDTTRTLNAVDPIVAGSDLKTGADVGGLGAVYTGNNASLFDDPLVSPVVADYAALFPNASLPPTLIQVGLREVLLSDAVRLYHQMKAAAPAPGHVAISPYEGMWHVFQSFLNIPEAATAGKEMGAYFVRALRGDICK